MHRRAASILPLALLLVSACAPAAARAQAPAWGAGAGAGEDRVFARQIAAKRLSDRIFEAALAGRYVSRKVAYPAPDGLTIPAYLFAPRDTARARPVIILVHGGIHGDFSAGHLETVRTLLERGYVVVAPEYRGSTGYGKAFYDAIDYGGREVEDCIAARDYLGAVVPFADTSRTLIMGWSHGGFIALHAVLRRPEAFRAAVAHVPVTDLPTRIRTHTEEYHQLFVDQPGFGARLEENPAPYIERSPIAHVRKLRVPVLVHAADNDEDVFIIENRNLRDSMVVAGMDRSGLYTYREFRDPPGGHSFAFVDSRAARESWAETLRFIAKHLK